MHTSDYISCRITRIMHILHHIKCNMTRMEHCTLATCPTQVVYYSIVRPLQWSVPFSNWLSRCLNFEAHSTSKRFLKIRCASCSFNPPFLGENFGHRIQRACSCSSRIFSIVTSLEEHYNIKRQNIYIYKCNRIYIKIWLLLRTLKLYCSTGMLSMPHAGHMQPFASMCGSRTNLYLNYSFQ